MEKETRFTRTAPSRRLIHRDSWLRYKRLTKKEKPENLVTSYLEFSKIARTILKKLAVGIINRKGGVFMKNLGYFCVWMSPVKSTSTSLTRQDGTKISLLNLEEPYPYMIHVFFHNKAWRDLNCWSMERTFHRDIKVGVSKNLRNFKNYTFHLSLIRRMFF